MPAPPVSRDLPRRAVSAEGGARAGVRLPDVTAGTSGESTDAATAVLSGPVEPGRSPAPRVKPGLGGLPARLWQAWLGWLAAYEADEREAARFLAQQLRAILQLTPLSMGINVANATVLVTLLWLQVPTGLLLGWYGAVAAIAAWGMRGWLRTRKRPLRPASPRGMRRAVLGAGVFGAAWGVVPAYCWPIVDDTGRLFVGMITAGMICAGGFAMSSLPPAAISYVTLMALGSMIGVVRVFDDPSSPGVLAMLATYALVVVYCVRP